MPGILVFPDYKLSDWLIPLIEFCSKKLGKLGLQHLAQIFKDSLRKLSEESLSGL